jgi:hypothetical protein
LTFLGAALVLVLAPAWAFAQLDEALSSYTGANGEGYMQPLANALGADLNSAFFYSAHIPKSGLRFSFEIAMMAVMFEDSDKTFIGTTEGGFMPETETEVPTIAGDKASVPVSGNGGTTFTFPGGFDLSSFALAVPQVRVGAVMGTEAVVRFFAGQLGDNEIGDVELLGIGARHSLSQYFETPVSLSIGGLWQSFKLGGDMVDSNSFTLGLQASKAFSLLEPYAGIAYDSFEMDLAFESDVSGTIETIPFDSITGARFTVGLGLNYRIGHAFAEYNLSDTNSFAFGVTVGN